MRFGNLVLGASLVFSAAASVQAETVTSTWGAWSAAANPDYSSTTGVGDFTPDSSSQFPATLSIDNSSKLFGGLFGDFYYTGAGVADFVLSSALLSDDVSNLTLAVNFGGNSFLEAPTLTIDGLSYAFDTQTVTSSGSLQGFGTSLYTFTWDLLGLGSGPFASGVAYDIAWQFNAHVAFTEISASQSLLQTSAVPEPGTYAMLLTGLASVGALVRRRRQAA